MRKLDTLRKPLVYMQMKLKLNLSDSPYKQTAGARNFLQI